MPAGTPSRDIGLSAEEKTLHHFENLGWKCLERNYRTPLGEIDLIFLDPARCVVFMEVKYRSSTAWGPPQSAVRSAKRSRLVKSALIYIKHKRLRRSPFRFDVAALTPEGLEHIPNAFQVSGLTF